MCAFLSQARLDVGGRAPPAPPRPAPSGPSRGGPEAPPHVPRGSRTVRPAPPLECPARFSLRAFISLRAAA